VSSSHYPLGKREARTGILPVLIGAVLVVAFFVAHQAWSTGFFTSNFGQFGTVLFYGALALGLTYPFGIPVALNRHFGRRIELAYDISIAIFWTIAAAWLLVVFPLNFSQLTAVVPGPLRFLLAWITNDIGRVLLGAALVGAFAFIPFYALQYLTGSREQSLTRHP